MKYIKTTSKNRVIAMALGAVVILAAIGAGAFSVLWREHAKPQAKAVAVPKVDAVLGPDLSLEGKVYALRIVAVPAPVQGKVDVFHAEIGQEIFEGQMLAQISSQSLAGAEEHALLLAERAKNRLNDIEAALIAGRLEASRARASASRLKSEYDRSEKAYQRQKMLLAAGATPRLAYEKAEKEYQTNQAESASADTLAEQSESRIQALLKEEDAAKKTVEETTVDLEHAKADLASAEVHAPVDGIIVGRRGSAGDDVDRSMTDLFQIATDLTHLAVIVEPPPSALARIRPGQSAVITIAEARNEHISAEVKKVENGQVTVEFQSPDPAVKPGLTAQVRIKLT
jgi:multidrug resistance efflux pump